MRVRIGLGMFGIWLLIVALCILRGHAYFSEYGSFKRPPYPMEKPVIITTIIVEEEELPERLPDEVRIYALDRALSLTEDSIRIAAEQLSLADTPDLSGMNSYPLDSLRRCTEEQREVAANLQTLEGQYGKAIKATDAARESFEELAKKVLFAKPMPKSSFAIPFLAAIESEKRMLQCAYTNPQPLAELDAFMDPISSPFPVLFRSSNPELNQKVERIKETLEEYIAQKEKLSKIAQRLVYAVEAADTLLDKSRDTVSQIQDDIQDHRTQLERVHRWSMQCRALSLLAYDVYAVFLGLGLAIIMIAVSGNETDNDHEDPDDLVS